MKAGAPKPDIGTPEALKATLLAAQSIAYSRLGASGVLFAGLIERLGIAEAVNAKATIIPSGLTGALVARGEVADGGPAAERARCGAGARHCGTPAGEPADAQRVLSRRLRRLGSGGGPARTLLQALASAEAAAAFRAAGLEPLR